MSRNEVLRLYRHILRNIKKLPPETRDYYKEYAKNEFMYYRKENDPKFIELAIKKGYENVDWVLKKYLGPRR